MEPATRLSLGNYGNRKPLGNSPALYLQVVRLSTLSAFRPHQVANAILRR